jgi:hypothetical protein
VCAGTLSGVRALQLVSLTLPAPDPEAAREWWSTQLELPPSEDDPTALDLGEMPLRFGPWLELRVVSYDVEEPTSVGHGVVVVPPDRAAGDRAEASIRSFIEDAADPGRSVDELADEITAVVLQAQQRIHAIVADQSNNKRLAVHLALGQRARDTEGSPPWHLHAAGTLTSGTFGPGDEG